MNLKMNFPQFYKIKINSTLGSKFFWVGNKVVQHLLKIFRNVAAIVFKLWHEKGMNAVTTETVLYFSQLGTLLSKICISSNGHLAKDMKTKRDSMPDKSNLVFE
jgi:hypothetical protein